MQKKPSRFKWGLQSQKQLQVINWWTPESPFNHHDIIICDGAIRSGKTVSMAFSYVEWATENFNSELFGIAGKTIGSLRQNVIEPLKKILHGRGYHVHEKRIEKLLIISKGRQLNTFECFGGRDESSQDLIQGRTLAGLLCDEVALMPQSFVNQATGRCSVPGSKIWFNCNPEGPFHWFKTEYLEKIQKKNIYHLHFNMDDNLTLTPEIKERYKRMYAGVFYKRFILGLWVMADGIIYDMFDETIHIEKAPDSLQNYIVGIDYGTAAPCTFNMWGWNNPKKLYKVKEYYYDSVKTGRQKTDSQYANDLVDWLDGVKVEIVYVDPSAASFIRELKNKGGWRVKKAKNDVIDGIRYVSRVLSNNEVKIDPSCKNTLKEMVSYIWDEKKQERGEDEPVKKNDHCMDGDRYALYTRFGRSNIIRGARTT